MTFSSHAAELEATTQISTPLKKRNSGNEKQKSIGDGIFLEGKQLSKIVAFEIVDRSEGEIIAVPAASGTVSGVKSHFSIVDPDRMLTEFGLSEMEATA